MKRRTRPCLLLLGAAAFAFWGSGPSSSLAGAAASDPVLAGEQRLEAPEEEPPHIRSRTPEEEARWSKLFAENFGGGRPDAAPARRELLAIDEATYGPEHPWTLNTRLDLAKDLLAARDAKAAETILRDLVTQSEARHTGLDQIDLLGSLSEAVQADGRFSEAEELERRILQLARTEHGQETDQTIASMGRLAAVLDVQGKSSEASELYRKALEFTLAQSGEWAPRDHPHKVIRRMNNLALSLSSQGELRRAETLLRQALDHARREGVSQPNQARFLVNLAMIVAKVGDRQEADELHRAAIAATRDAPDMLWGADLWTARVSYAHTLLNFGRAAEAQTLLREVSPDLKNRSGERDSLLVLLLARARELQGDHVGAETLYREALALDGDLSPEARSRFGATLLRRGRAREALDILRPAVGRLHASRRAARADDAFMRAEFREGRSTFATFVEAAWREACAEENRGC